MILAENRQLLDDLAERVASWHRRCDAQSPAVMEIQPAPGVWSIKQNTFHVADAFEASTHRLNAMLTEHEPMLLRFDADVWAAERRYQEREFTEASEQLDRHLNDFLALARTVDEDGLRRTGRQPNLAMNYLGLPTDVLTVAHLFRFEVGHVDEHLVSVDEILAEHGTV